MPATHLETRALIYYHFLISQGVNEATAFEHTAQRFGISADRIREIAFEQEPFASS